MDRGTADLQPYEVLNRDTPISSLPNEILSDIFVCGQRMIKASKFASSYSSSDPTEATSPSTSSSKHEITISAVSFHWRDVAIHQPLLWNDISISPNTSVFELVTYLERSLDCLLNLRLNFDYKDPGNLGLQMLIMQVQRWRKLSIKFDGEASFETFLLRLHDLEAPNLVHLSMNVNALCHLELMPNNIDDPLPQIFTGGAPVLSFVRLASHAMAFFRPPLTKMTTLHLDQTTHLPMSYAHFHRVLTSSPVLANLSIYGDMIGAHIWPMSNSIDMPALRSLRICGISGFVYCGLLLSISAPRLESLVLKGVLHHDLDGLWESPQMPKFPILHSLTFCDFECTESTYKRLFRAFPAITDFASLHSNLRTPRVLKLIGENRPGIIRSGAVWTTSFPEVNLPWPELQTMSLLFDFDDETPIVRMVDTRIRLERPIAKLRLGGIRGEYLQTPHLGNWLQEHVQVEIFDGVDPWPFDLQDVDEDDNLF